MSVSPGQPGLNSEKPCLEKQTKSKEIQSGASVSLLDWMAATLSSLVVLQLHQQLWTHP